ncbi:uncharacterized protein LOC135310906 [Phalacrocorax carbo]|uniref:uncharacterized protein LOC135310906 n=1 Tax=Phalacrocorax carbo TaxID=9209 RepID=UPI00311A57FA
MDDYAGALSLIRSPADIFNKDNWVRIKEELAERAMMGKTQYIQLWGKIHRLLLKARDDQETWQQVQLCLHGATGDSSPEIDPGGAVGTQTGASIAGDGEEAGSSDGVAWPTTQSEAPEEADREAAVFPVEPAGPLECPPAYPWDDLAQARVPARGEGDVAADAAGVTERKEKDDQRRQRHRPLPDPRDWLPGQPLRWESGEEGDWGAWRGGQGGYRSTSSSSESEVGGETDAHMWEDGADCLQRAKKRHKAAGTRRTSQKEGGEGPPKGEVRSAAAPEGSVEDVLRQLQQVMRALGEVTRRQTGLLTKGAPQRQSVELPDWRLIARDCSLDGVRIEMPGIFPVRIAPGGGAGSCKW